MRLVAILMGFFLLLGPVWTGPATADEVRLAVPEETEANGFMRHLLPRFSLKTGVRVTLDPQASLRIHTGETGLPVFQRGDIVYRLDGDHGAPPAARFKDWLTSEIGMRTVAQFTPPAPPAYTAPQPQKTARTTVLFDGDAKLGAKAALTHCGRCHVVGPENAMNSIGSTPSFAALRTLGDWDVKFQQFFVLRPHGVFTQIEGVTEPFDPAIPPPIAPVAMTVDDLAAILAFVERIEPADLGEPLHLQ